MAENAISTVFNRPGIAGFTLLRSGVKFPPIEEGWQKKGHSFEEAMAHRGNIGLLAGNGYIGFDKDKPEAFNGLILSSTTTWETRPGRLGMWFKCNDRTPEVLTKYGFKKPDHAQIKLYDGRNIIDGYHPHIGEIKLERTYQIIPPSWKIVDGQRVDYKMLEEVPPAEVSLDWLLSELLRIGIVFSEKPKAPRYEANAKKLEGRKNVAATRKQDKTAKAREFLLEAALRAIPGHRNDAGFGLACQLRDLGLQPGDASEYLRKFAFSLDDQKGEPYTQAEAMESLAQAYSREPRDPPKRQTEEQAGDLLERIKADPRALKDPVILAALAALKANDRIEYDLLLEAIKKAGTGIKVATINDMVDKCILESEKAKERPQETPKSIKEKAQAIAERGDPFKYLVWQAQRNHLGDIDMHTVLISSIASAASETSHGLQPGNNGDSGSGKDDACEAVYHLVPSDRKLDGSLSPMSLFYLEKDGLLKPGMILYSDDVEYLPIIPIFKRSSARFQKYTNHYSVSSGKERTGLKMTIPPRMVWWMTSVESVANLEAFGRLYPTSTDSRPGHKQKVATEIAARRARKELKLAEDEGIEVAREIIADIFENGPFKVLISQAEKAKWLKTSDFRGQEQFWDLVDAQVVLHWRQRKRDENGWLVAEDQDLVEAKAIHTGHKVAHFSNLTEAEAKVIGVMSSGRAMTQKELTEALDVAQSTLSVRLKSIMFKSAIITEDYDQGKKVYAINPKMNLGTDYWDGLDLIELGLDSIKTYRSQQIALSGCYRYVIGLPIGIIINNSNRIPSSLSINMEESKKKGYPCDDCESCQLKEYISSLHISDKSYDNGQKQQQ